MTNQLATIEHAKEKLVEMGIAYGPKVLAAIFIMVIGFFVARWVADMFQRWFKKMDLEPPVKQLMLRIIRLVVLLLFFLIALQNLEVQLLPLIAGLGVAGAGIAFAMQGVLGNLFAGLTIIFTKPFKVGEYVEMVGVEGRVETIELFSTKLSHPDKSKIVVPNRKIVGEILHNYGSIRQLDLTVGVAYNTDLNEALAAVSAVLAADKHVLKDFPPVVGVTVLANSAINIAVKPWVQVVEYGPAVAAINKAIVEDFRKRNISIPFPQHEIRLLNPAA